MGGRIDPLPTLPREPHQADDPSSRSGRVRVTSGIEGVGRQPGQGPVDSVSQAVWIARRREVGLDQEFQNRAGKIAPAHRPRQGPGDRMPANRATRVNLA